MVPLAIVSADKEIVELARSLGGFDVVGVFDRNPAASVLGLPVLGSDDDFAAVAARFPGLRVVVSVDGGRLKERLVGHYGMASVEGLVSRDAFVSPTAVVGAGCILQQGTRVLTEARLGRVCKVNVNAVVHHDGQVGDFCTLAPGCQLLGAVRVGRRVFVGAGAIVLPHVEVADDAVIGAGAVVTRDVAAGVTVVGSPARPLPPRP